MKRYKSALTLLGCVLLGLVLLAVDLVTKALADAANVQQGEYFLGIIRLYVSHNTGISFGFLADNPLAMEIMSYINVALAIGIVVVFFTLFKNNLPVRVCLVVIEAGAIGNIIDRFCLGYVRDFVDVAPLGFGICNVADFFITGGVVALVICILFIGKDAAFPLKEQWREQAKLAEAAKTEGRDKGND